MNHLADLGHRDIAFIGESEGVYRRHTGFGARTLAGFRRRAAERGVRAVHRAAPLLSLLRLCHRSMLRQATASATMTPTVGLPACRGLPGIRCLLHELVGTAR